MTSYAKRASVPGNGSAIPETMPFSMLTRNIFLFPLTPGNYSWNNGVE